MAGLNPGTKIKGSFDLLSEIMTREGMTRFRAYLAKHPVMTEIQKRRVMVAFLDKFARPEAIEEEPVVVAAETDPEEKVDTE